MHIPDGSISPHITIPAWTAAAPLWAWSLKRMLRGDAVERLPVIGSLTAFAFVIQTIMIPIPGGTSAHIAGAVLIAILYDPLTAFACESLVLLIQAFVLGIGGITVLPLNALALGLLGPLAGWASHLALRNVSRPAALFFAGWAGMVVGAAALGGLLGLQHAISPSHFPIPFKVVFPALTVPHLFVGIVEGTYTLLAYAMLQKVLARAAR
ncbi:MAG: energy-coupling factor ABC transporter permease [Deltaproteobacteria bacterium]|nr:energy-coupling factor ABC transporter permease [Deltaproteobacteria bacterium]